MVLLYFLFFFFFFQEEDGIRDIGVLEFRRVLFRSNAVGMPLESAERLIPAFSAAGLNFVTWELRGSPGPWTDPCDHEPDTHVADAEWIIDYLNLGRVHLLGWCTGGAISLFRSEERSVGKECRSRWSPYH